MEIALLALIPLVLLAGIVLFAVGNRGWNWGTITAAVLVLLTAAGYTFLVGMLGQRERAWREIVTGYQAALARERDALVPGGEGKLVPDRARKSIAALQSERARWQRVRDRVESWRGRHWQKAALEPPVVGPDGSVKAGRLTIEEVDKLTINEGAELYLFDAAPIEENGRFLGAFGVESVNGNTLTIVPALPPTDSDLALWRTPREEVAVYEDLPVDRWLAFHRTVAPGAEEDTGHPVTPPEQRKLDPEEMLKHLEGELEELRQHATAVPEEEWPKIIAGLESGEILPGTYWATVQFKESRELPRPGHEPEQFEPGRRATFDFDTARKLQADGAADIVSVERRRPLADAQTSIRGSDYALAGDERPVIRTEGVTFMRRMLESDIASITAMRDRLKEAKVSADGQLQLAVREGEDLAADRDRWIADAEASDRVAARFEARLAEAGTELSAVETAIVELGRELAGASALVVDAIDARAPAPTRRPAAAAP